MAKGKNGAIYLDKTVTVEEGFDPRNVNWGDLLTLYQDDPLLSAVFASMKEWVQGDDGDAWPYKYQWTLNGPSSVSLSKGTVASTTSNITIHDPITISYDKKGTMKIT